MPSQMIMTRSGIAAAALLAISGRVAAQQPGSIPEVHPPLTTWKCTRSGGCVAQNTSVVLDWNYRAITQVGGTASCKVAGSNVDTFTMSTSLCPNEAACAKNCEVQGANYTAMGVTTSGGTLTMYHYVRGPDGKLNNATPRILLLGPDDNYVMLKLVGQELSYDVDLSKIPCGENGALYLSEMDASGNKNENNQGGAAYGSGYCDAQCPVRAYRNGRLNTGRQPACCAEMDIQEANSRAIAFTPHPCRGNSCDAAGCGYNPYQSGQRNFYGPGQQLDTNKPFTVVTQFVANGANISQIKRLYVQNGRTLPSANGHVINGCGSDNPNGGMSGMSQSLSRGMVLIFSIWNDPVQNMGWLDSGGAGPCGNGEGTPANILNRYPDTHVIFSNIRWGDIGSTVKT